MIFLLKHYLTDCIAWGMCGSGRVFAKFITKALVVNSYLAFVLAVVNKYWWPIIRMYFTCYDIINCGEKTTYKIKGKIYDVIG